MPLHLAAAISMCPLTWTWGEHPDTQHCTYKKKQEGYFFSFSKGKGSLGWIIPLWLSLMFLFYIFPKPIESLEIKERKIQWFQLFFSDFPPTKLGAPCMWEKHFPWNILDLFVLRNHHASYGIWKHNNSRSAELQERNVKKMKSKRYKFKMHTRAWLNRIWIIKVNVEYSFFFIFSPIKEEIIW